jgi:hypothetical protein
MAVEEHRRLAGGFKGFGINEGVKACWDDFNGLEAGASEVVCNPSGSAVDVRFVLALGADGGDPEKFVKFSEMLLAATFYKFSKVHRRPPGAMIMIQFK